MHYILEIYTSDGEMYKHRFNDYPKARSERAKMLQVGYIASSKGRIPGVEYPDVSYSPHHTVKGVITAVKDPADVEAEKAMDDHLKGLEEL